MAPSQLLTRMDMSDEENVKDAHAELRRAENDPAKLAVWAAKWGEALVVRCLETEGDPPELEDEGLSARLQEKIDIADKAIKEACEALGKLPTSTMLPATARSLAKVVDDLEAAL